MIGLRINLELKFKLSAYLTDLSFWQEMITFLLFSKIISLLRNMYKVG